MWESRMRSAVQLLGRAPMQGGEAGINAAAATVRAYCACWQQHRCMQHAQPALLCGSARLNPDVAATAAVVKLSMVD